MRGFLLGLLLLITTAPAMAQLDVRDLAVYEDRSGTETINEVASLPDAAFSPRPNGLSAGYTRSVHWLRFAVQAPLGESGDWWLEIHPTYLDDIRLFEADPAHPGEFIERRTGDMFPFAERELPYRGFLLRISLAENESRLYHLRLQTTSPSLMMIKLWTVKRFNAAVPGEYALLGAAMGLLAIILFINLIYSWYQREAINSQYTVYIATVLASSVFVQGFAAQFLLPDQPALVNDLQKLSSFLMAAAAGPLYQSVLLIDRKQRVLWLLYRTLTFLPLLLLPAIPFGYFTEAQRIVISFGAFMALIALGRSVQLLRNKAAGGMMLVVATMSSVAAFVLANTQMLGLFVGHFAVLHIFLIGTIGNVIALHLAIDARVRAQKMLHQQTIEQARLSELKADREMRARNEQANFISMITHEIKTPLAAVAAATDALEILENPPPPGVMTRIERIRRNVQRIDGIFDRYLAMDRIGNARLDPHFLECSLHDVIARATRQFTGESQRLHVRPGEDARLVCDTDLVATAILNMIDNAMKYSPADEPVDLTTRIFQGRDIVIEVIDRGPGVPDELRDAIFHRYVRAPEFANISGIGVGLSLVRKIAEIHRGNVTVLNDEDGGARFRLTLPLRMAT